MAKYKNKWVGVALAAAIAFSTLLPFFATYNAPATPSNLASVFGEKVLICTGEGFTWVKLTDWLAGKTPIKQHKGYFCPLCYLAHSPMGKALLLTAAAVYLTRRNASGLSLVSLGDSILKSLVRATSYPRAPPLSFSY